MTPIMKQGLVAITITLSFVVLTTTEGKLILFRRDVDIIDLSDALSQLEGESITV